jgi:uncharacterized membrane-anchored protein YhcB (DUF1043 family)
MVWVAAVLMTVTGLFITYIAMGLARNKERQRAYLECEDRLSALRRQLLRRAR